MKTFPTWLAALGILACWALASSGDYRDQKEAECASITGPVPYHYNPDTDLCEKVNHGTPQENRPTR